MAMPETAVGAASASMERLDFVLPDFTRHMWVSGPLRATWAPRVQQAVAAWLDIEWHAIREGVRRCAATIVTPHEFPAKGAAWAATGLNSLPVEMVGATGHSYSSTSTTPAPGGPFAYRFVVGAPADVTAFKEAWDEGDQEAIGSLLGYPPCCQRFFRRTWVDEGMVDTTWPMALATNAPGRDGRTVEVTAADEANILLRWLGIRAVPHLPCSFDCHATVELGRALLDVGERHGFGAEVGWIREMLSWPVEWSALHGIAEIKTPIVKISTRTDATATKYVVRRQSATYPVDGVEGLSFPYRVPSHQRVSASAGFQRGLEQAVTIRSGRPSWYASDNGFASVEAMDAAHEPVVTAARKALEGSPAGRVLDLGCGNGALLAKICVEPDLVPVGIDVHPGPVEHARRLFGGRGRFVIGDLAQSDELWLDGGRYRLALIMPGRLLEIGPEAAAGLLTRLANECDTVLAYAYGDWLTRAGGLLGLLEAAGLQQAAGTAGDATVARVRFDTDPEAARWRSR